MIKFTVNRQTEKMMRDLIKTQNHRWKRGQELMLLEIATRLWRSVWKAGTTVPLIGDKDWDYTRHLRVAPLYGAPGGEIAVAVWVETDQQELSAEDMARTAIRVVPAYNAPAWVQVLGSWDWFPAQLLPNKIPATQAKILARSLREKEAAALLEEFVDDRAVLMRQLAAADAPMRLEPPENIRVYVDLAWEVLRAEFGFNGKKKDPRWRNALRDMHEQIPRAAKHFVDYLVDGKTNRFDTYNSGNVSWKQVQDGIHFEKELMPYVKGTKG